MKKRETCLCCLFVDLRPGLDYDRPVFRDVRTAIALRGREGDAL